MKQKKSEELTDQELLEEVNPVSTTTFPVLVIF
jgi:hypothetical protein